ncbi:GNAT family N-acetyltransferase [Streptomyces sp. Y1]|uniref:GNAT family N-acetyltransferase n=1 Tax=Streptomyces sp. Y1 TaxID=3238634 RepID=A0AB39TKI0_9ACTN
MVPVRLTGPRLAIREHHHTPEEVAALHAVFGDPEVTRHLPFGPRDPDTCADQLELCLDEAMAEPRRVYRLAVTLRADATGEADAGAGTDVDAADPARATLIGQGSLTLGPRRSAHLGYALRRDAWGRGYAGELAGLLCGLAFGPLGVHRLVALTDVDNRASARVLTRLGFQLEGRVRHDVYRDGVWSDSQQYALLADEWPPPGAAAPAEGTAGG